MGFGYGLTLAILVDVLLSKSSEAAFTLSQMSGGTWVAIALGAILVSLTAAVLLDLPDPWFWLIPVVALFLALAFGMWKESRPCPPPL